MHFTSLRLFLLSNICKSRTSHCICSLPKLSVTPLVLTSWCHLEIVQRFYRLFDPILLVLRHLSTWLRRRVGLRSVCLFRLPFFHVLVNLLYSLLPIIRTTWWIHVRISSIKGEDQSWCRLPGIPCGIKFHFSNTSNSMNPPGLTLTLTDRKFSEAWSNIFT